MDTTGLSEQIAKLIPTGLDDIVRANRDHLCIRLPIDGEVAAISGHVHRGTPKMTFGHWRIVVFDLRTTLGEQRTDLILVGEADGRGQATSPITRLDMQTGFARTYSGSLYRLSEPISEGEPDQDELILICALLWKWGWGVTFGIPHFFY